jgi:hypothetical protein
LHTLRTYQILEFLEDGILVKRLSDEEEIKLTKAIIPKIAIVGDLIRHCEHNFYDIIDENGEFIYR